MKKPVFIFAFIFSRLISFGQNDTLVLDGHYMNKNIYIQAATNCVVNVLVNGSVYPDTEFATAFEIDLKLYKLNPGDPVHIDIIHKNDCLPKVMTGVIDAGVTVEYLNISIDSTGMLKWKTKNEIEKFPFTVEQFRWNKWVKVGEVDGKGGDGENEYSFQTVPTSGENKFRVKQYNYISPVRCSDPATFISKVPPVKIKSNSVSTEIEFSAETLYELYDKNGNIVRRGFGKTIDCSKLQRGYYFLNYDNLIMKIEKN